MPTLHVTRVKHGRPSAHPIRGDEMRMLRKLPRTTPYVFTTERGGLPADAINRQVKTIGARAGLPFPVHTHMLRHGCGYALANLGTNAGNPGFAGHANIQHTVRYTELAPQRSPRASGDREEPRPTLSYSGAPARPASVTPTPEIVVRPVTGLSLPVLKVHLVNECLLVIRGSANSNRSPCGAVRILVGVRCHADVPQDGLGMERRPSQACTAKLEMEETRASAAIPFPL